MASQQLVQGRIIWASLPDPEGKNRKDRPAVILTRTDELQSNEPFVVVAATTTFREPLPPSSVKLPWHPRGAVRTRLRKPTVAVCNWLITIREQDILDFGGIVPADVMMKIVTQAASPG